LDRTTRSLVGERRGFPMEQVPIPAKRQIRSGDPESLLGRFASWKQQGSDGNSQDGQGWAV